MNKEKAIKKWKLKIIINNIFELMNINYRYVFYFSKNKDELVHVEFRKWEDKNKDYLIKLKSF